MKTTYYYGDIDFGRFTVDGSESKPLAILNRINLIREFETPQEAWEFYCLSNGEHESYISVDAKDEDDVKYQLVFNKERL